jgi:hypothetical protein
VVTLQQTLVMERWPLRGVNRFAGGVAALAIAWAVGILLWKSLVAGDGAVSGGDFGAALTCIGTVQVVFYVIYRGWPFSRIGSDGPRLWTANAIVLAAGLVTYLGLRALGVESVTVAAVAGSVIAAGLVIGMLFEGWLESFLSATRARLAQGCTVAALAALLYLALKGYAGAVDFTRANPEEWIAYAGLNAIGAGVILHVAIGHRWPFLAAQQAEA